MAKPRRITRTISTTVADILCLDIETGEACNRSFTFPGQFKKDNEILKAAAKKLETTEPNVHAVHVVGIAKLLGITDLILNMTLLITIGADRVSTVHDLFGTGDPQGRDLGT